MRPMHKSFDRPDQVLEFDRIREDIVELGDLTLGRVIHQPGWRWSVHMKPVVGTETCQARHLGYIVSGQVGFLLVDGSSITAGPGMAYDVPPGHDGWVVGDEPLVVIEWAGVREWVQRLEGERALVALLLTDIVGSTAHARRIGDVAWRRLLGEHNEAVRAELARARAREVATTGDGVLALFTGPAGAIRSAIAIGKRIKVFGLELRQGIHVGEVDVVGSDVRGIAVHEVARITALAAPGEILVSDVARALAGPGISLEARGEHELKGADSRVLFAVASAPVGDDERDL
jgi:class 3 adenylate cyclase